MTDDRDDNFVDRRDLLVTVGDVEGDGLEVIVLIREHILRETHHRLADVGTLRFRRAGEREVGLLVQRVADRNVVAGDDVFVRVEYGRVEVTDDRDGDVDREDLLIAVGDVEGDGSEVRVLVCEHVLRETHHRLACVGALGCRRAGEREVAFLVQRVADRDVISRDFVLSSVIVGRVEVTDDRNGDVDRFDRLIAVGDVEYDPVKVRIRIREHVLRKAHVRRADVGALRFRGAGEREVGFRIQRIADRHVVAGDFVLGSVVRIGAVVTDDRDDDRADRIDRDETVGDVEGNGPEVRVRVREHLLLETHIRRADLGTRRFRRAGEREVGFLIQRVADRHVVAGDLVLLRIVGHGIVVTDDRDGHVDREDLLITVGDVERDGSEVRVRVREHVLRKAHHRLAGVGACRSRGAGEREVRFLIQRVADRHVVAGDFMFGSVVIGRVSMADDRNDDLACGGDSDVAVGDDERDARKVLVRILEHFLLEVHIRRTDLGALRFRSAGEREVGFLIKRVADRHVVAGYAVFRSVVIGRVVVADDRNGDFACRRDLLITVGDVEGNGPEVRVRVHEHLLRETHVRRADVGTRRFRSAGEREARFRIQRIACFHIVAGHGVRLAVVRIGAVMTDDRDGDVDRFDLLVTVVDDEGDTRKVRIVVLELRSVDVHLRLADVGALCFRRTAEREVGFLVQRVVDLDVVAGHNVFVPVEINGTDVSVDGDGHVDLLDFQRAGDGGDGEALGHVGAVRSSHVRFAGHVDGVFAGVHFGAFRFKTGDIVFLTVDRELQNAVFNREHNAVRADFLESFDRMRRTVVIELAAVGDDLDRFLFNEDRVNDILLVLILNVDDDFAERVRIRRAAALAPADEVIAFRNRNSEFRIERIRGEIGQIIRFVVEDRRFGDGPDGRGGIPVDAGLVVRTDRKGDLRFRIFRCVHRGQNELLLVAFAGNRSKTRADDFKAFFGIHERAVGRHPADERFAVRSGQLTAVHHFEERIELIFLAVRGNGAAAFARVVNDREAAFRRIQRVQLQNAVLDAVRLIVEMRFEIERRAVLESPIDKDAAFVRRVFGRNDRIAGNNLGGLGLAVVTELTGKRVEDDRVNDRLPDAVERLVLVGIHTIGRGLDVFRIAFRFAPAEEQIGDAVQVDSSFPCDELCAKIRIIGQKRFKRDFRRVRTRSVIDRIRQSLSRDIGEDLLVPCKEDVDDLIYIVRVESVRIRIAAGQSAESVRGMIACDCMIFSAVAFEVGFFSAEGEAVGTEGRITISIVCTKVPPFAGVRPAFVTVQIVFRPYTGSGVNVISSSYGILGDGFIVENREPLHYGNNREDLIRSFFQIIDGYAV